MKNYVSEFLLEESTQSSQASDEDDSQNEDTPDSHFCEANFSENNDDSSLTDESFEAEIGNFGEDIASEDAIISNVEFSVDSNYQKEYLITMNKRLQVHGAKFKVGETVLLKKDFDNNQKNKKICL